jgi:hypothetical protein
MNAPGPLPVPIEFTRRECAVDAAPSGQCHPALREGDAPAIRRGIYLGFMNACHTRLSIDVANVLKTHVWDAGQAEKHLEMIKAFLRVAARRAGRDPEREARLLDLEPETGRLLLSPEFARTQDRSWIIDRLATLASSAVYLATSQFIGDGSGDMGSGVRALLASPGSSETGPGGAVIRGAIATNQR